MKNYEVGILNVDMSRSVYQKNKAHIELNMCYNNVFNVLLYDSLICHQVISREYFVAYGYMRVKEDEPFFVRHCFLMTKDNEVIDPTMPLFTNPNLKADYIVLKKFECYIDYLEALEKNNREPNLAIMLFKEDHEISRKAFENNLIFIF